MWASLRLGFSFFLRYHCPMPIDPDDPPIWLPGLTLDFDYLWLWAERLGLQSELHYVLISAKR